MTATMYQLPTPSVRDRVSAEEWAARVELACAYRIAGHHGWNHMVFNHISYKIPGSKNEFLLNPYGLLYREITASSLVKINLDGDILDDSPHDIIEAGWVIHSAIHAARPDVKCIIHTHTTAGVAVGVQKEGLLPVNMAAIYFYNRIGYHDYEGPSINLEERERLAEHLGQHDALILRNHGLISCGDSIGKAMFRHYQLESACAVQVAALAGGRELHFPPPEMCEAASRSSNRPKPIDKVWAAYRRMADDLYPGYDA